MENKGVTDPFRAELIREFASRSSEFLYFQVNDYMTIEGKFLDPKIEGELNQVIDGFKPDIVFSLNRAGLTPAMLSRLNCPILSWYIDNPNRFAQALRQFSQNEKVFCATRYQLDWLKSNSSVRSEQATYAPFCTNDKIFYPGNGALFSRECDVSFVGTLWDTATFCEIVNNMSRTPAEKKKLEEWLARYLANYDFDFASTILESIRPTPLDRTALKNIADDFISSQKRLEVLDQLSDLKLEIYGTRQWPGLALLRSMALFRSFRPEGIETSAALSDLYRRSKVGLSIAHYQAQTGMPIRIFDILASGAVLVSDRHQELCELFEEGKMFLAYQSPREARDCVDRILRDKEGSEKMSRRAIEEVRAKHTFQVRVNQFLATNEVLQPKSVTFLSNGLDDRFLRTDPRFSDARFSRISLQKGYRPAPDNRHGIRFVRTYKAGNHLLTLLRLAASFILSLLRLSFSPRYRKLMKEGIKPSEIAFQTAKIVALQISNALSEADKSLHSYFSDKPLLNPTDQKNQKKLPGKIGS